jgi:hypothetical protein
MNRQKSLLTASIITISMLLSGCSDDREKGAPPRQSAGESSETAADASATAYVAAKSEAQAGPDVRVSAAPGVAFDYHYAFRVEDARISAVQEGHAAACETLGLSRCRITGMRYSLVDKDEVTASLAFKLDPSIARKFGKDAIASVEKAKGILVDSQIEGTDVGSGISASQRRSSDIQAELSRIEARLKAGGLGDRERTELQQQVADLRAQLDDEHQTRSEGEKSLATTPMEFTYAGGSDIPGFESGNPFARAWNTAVASFAAMLGFVLLLSGAILPWILFLALLVALWRAPFMRGVRKWWSRKPETTIEAVAD